MSALMENCARSIVQNCLKLKYGNTAVDSIERSYLLVMLLLIYNIQHNTVQK